MSETEDTRVAAGNGDIQKSIDEKSSELNNVETSREEPEVKKAESHVEKAGENPLANTTDPVETEQKKATESATLVTSSPTTKQSFSTAEKAGQQEDQAGPRVGAPGTTDGCNEIAPVGEWNSLPVLVERLRAALELSLAASSRRDDDPPPTLLATEDSGIDSEEDFRIRSSMEQAVLGCKEPDLRKDLKFLEDLLLSDIQTALSRLRETLERTDVVALAKHSSASDPSSKLHLLKLVSSLLSRLHVPEEEISEARPLQPVLVAALPSTSLSRRRRGTRHTIGVSTEELARARKWLEEERSGNNNVTRLDADEQVPSTSKEQNETTTASGGSSSAISGMERRTEEVHDKCTKDAINQRQSLRDRNKENLVHCGTNQLLGNSNNSESIGGEASFCRSLRDKSSDNYHGSRETDVGGRVVQGMEEEMEEKSRVDKLAAALKQRAEFHSSSGRLASTNKFVAKKSKIKRANTIDIPSYLKLQAESLGRDGGGCVSLRRPIDASHRTSGFNATNVAVPSFQPKTENDRKFLALINKNNENPVFATPAAAPFKTFGYPKSSDVSLNENWNSRFSNIKTSFDKPSSNEEIESRPSQKARFNKRFPCTPQTYGPSNQRNLNERMNYGDPRIGKMNSTDSTGFRHAPSSPFRRIEKPLNPSPTKVPPSYHWSRNDAPAPTNTLREKAKLMFDRENRSNSTSIERPDLHEKPSFPRPPWIEQDRNNNEGKTCTLTENGKLDYRLFYKQFAPFAGKSAQPSKLEESRHRDFANNSGVIDGKITLKMLPGQRTQLQSYPAADRRDLREATRENLGGNEGRNAFESRNLSEYDRRYSEANQPRSSFVDATLRGSSSVAVQTGIHDEQPDEERSFRVAPRVTKNPPLARNNASVQTNDVERPVIKVSDVETARQWKPMFCYDQRDIDRAPDAIYPTNDLRRFVLDHNQNYHAVTSSDSNRNASSTLDLRRIIASESSALEDGSSLRSIPNSQLHTRIISDEKTSPHEVEANRKYTDRCETRDHSPLLGPRSTCDRKAEAPNSKEEKTEDWSTDNKEFLDDQNIQNQDISPEVGVVTRYTCAIATVASSIDSPEPRSEEVFETFDSRTSSSPSPSHWSYSHSRPPTSERLTPEEDIRRHNLLQQSLVRRLQNESASLNNVFQPVHCPSSSTDRVGHGRPARNLERPSLRAVNQSSVKPGVPRVEKVAGLVQPPKSNRSSSLTESTVFNRSAKFVSPVRKKLEPTMAAGPVTVNRVCALREAYEQPSNALTKPIQKERSPIPNGLAPNDSSDEYLVSCSTNPSRSIVLSKSESWHQLAMTGNSSSSRTQRENNVSSRTTSSSRLSSHPKPPKPKSPSSQKLRSKQYEASSMADSVKKMEDKIRRYFESPGDSVETKESQMKCSRHSQNRNATANKGLVGLSRSRTMPGICDEKLRLLMTQAPQMPLLNVNTADVDKVFDDLFEEATRADGHQS